MNRIQFFTHSAYLAEKQRAVALTRYQSFRHVLFWLKISKYAQQLYKNDILYIINDAII